MAKNFYVLDSEGNTVYEGKVRDDGPHAFSTFDAAEKRAKAYAQTMPGEAIRVVGVLATVTCEVSAPKTKKLR